MGKFKLGYAVRNKKINLFLTNNKNIVRMEDAGSFIIFAFRHTPRTDSPDWVYYSDPRVAGIDVPNEFLRLIGEII